MLRLLLAFLISVSLLVCWGIGSTLLLATFLRGNEWLLTNQALPGWAPIWFYGLFAPAENLSDGTLIGLGFFGSVFLYTVVVYLILTLIAGFRRRAIKPGSVLA